MGEVKDEIDDERKSLGSFAGQEFEPGAVTGGNLHFHYRLEARCRWLLQRTGRVALVANGRHLNCG